MNNFMQLYPTITKYFKQQNNIYRQFLTHKKFQNKTYKA